MKFDEDINWYIVSLTTIRRNTHDIKCSWNDWVGGDCTCGLWVEARLNEKIIRTLSQFIGVEL